MKKQKLLIFLASLLIYFTGTSQVLQPQRVWVQDNLRPPLDTIGSPFKLGEIRARLQDTSYYMAMSLTGRKWFRTGGIGIGGGGSDGNNYTSGLSYNTGTQILTLSRVGLSNLTTSIPIPVYNGTETKVEAGGGGILVTGIGSVGSPYVVTGTLDGNSYPTALSYIGSTLTMDRNGLSPLTVNIPASLNNYPTSLSYSSNTLTMGRNGLSNLSVAIPLDGNNYTTSGSYSNSILTLNRSGLTPLNITIPAIDTNVLSTRLWRNKGLDSLGLLTKTRKYFSSDNTINVTKKFGSLEDSIDFKIGSLPPAVRIKSSNSTVTVTYNGPQDTVDLSVGPATVDTNLIATRAWRKKGDDSLALLTKARYFYSSDNSIGVVRKLGSNQDTIDITSLDTAISTLILSGDNSVDIEYKQGITEDTFDIRIPTPGASVGDNWGTQYAWTDGTLQGNGLISTPLSIDTSSLFFTASKVRRYIQDSLVTLYTGDGTLSDYRTVTLGSGGALDIVNGNGRNMIYVDEEVVSLESDQVGLNRGTLVIETTGVELAKFISGGVAVISATRGSLFQQNTDDSLTNILLKAVGTLDGVLKQSRIGIDWSRVELAPRDSVVINDYNNLYSPRIVYSRYTPMTSPRQLTDKFHVDSLINTRNVNFLVQDEGIGLGSSGTVNLFNFIGAGVTASRSGNSVTVNIPGGGGGGTGTVTSVGLTMPAAFTVLGGPVTTSGTLAVTANGSVGQYINGAGGLTTFPTIPTYDGSETKVNAGANITRTGAGTIASPYVINGNPGTVTSVSLTAPSAFTVLGSPITGSGTLQLTAAGTSGQYINGAGGLTTFPTIPTYDGSETKLVAGTNVTITGTGTAGNQYVINATGGGGGGGSVTSVGLVGFSGISVSNSPITTSGNISLSTSLNGIMYGTGSGFAAGTVSAPLSFSAGNLSISQAATSTNGYLSSTDWNTFNTKHQQYRISKDGTTQAGLGLTSNIDFTGAGVNVSYSGGTTTVNIPSSGGTDLNNYVTGASVAGGTLTINRLGLSSVTTTFNSDAVPQGSTNKYDQVVSVTGSNGNVVTGTYPNFNVAAPTMVTGLFASKSTLTAASGYNFCYVKGIGSSFEISNKVLKVGHGTNDDQRTITINSMLYVSSFSTGSWVHVATIPTGYRPSGLVSFAVSDVIPGVSSPATTPIRGSDGLTGITDGCVYSGSSGYIDPDTGFVYIRLQSITSLATLSGSSVVILPINITYFLNIGS